MEYINKVRGGKMVAILFIVMFTSLLKGFYDLSKINYKDSFIDVCMELIIITTLHLLPAIISAQFLQILIDI